MKDCGFRKACILLILGEFRSTILYETSLEYVIKILNFLFKKFDVQKTLKRQFTYTLAVDIKVVIGNQLVYIINFNSNL